MKKIFTVMLFFLSFAFPVEISDFLKNDIDIDNMKEEIKNSNNDFTIHLYELYLEDYTFEHISFFKCRYKDIKYISNEKIKISGDEYDIADFIHTNNKKNYTPNEIVKVFVLFDIVFSIQELDEIQFVLNDSEIGGVIPANQIPNSANIIKDDEDFFIHIEDRYSHVIPDHLKGRSNSLTGLEKYANKADIAKFGATVFALGVFYNTMGHNKNAQNYTSTNRTQIARYYKNKYEKNKDNIKLCAAASATLLTFTIYFEWEDKK